MAVDRFATIRRPIYGQTQKKAYTTTATISNPLPSGTAAVRVVTTTAAYVRVGYGSTLAATTADHYCNANQSYDIPLEPPGNNDTGANVSAGAFVAAVQDATGGNLIVTPLSD